MLYLAAILRRVEMSVLELIIIFLKPSVNVKRVGFRYKPVGAQ